MTKPKYGISHVGGLKAVAAVLLLVLVFIGYRSPPASTRGRADLTAFYCAGHLLQSHQDPYLFGPMHACEAPIEHFQHAVEVVPAPLPPLAIATFGLLSNLPYFQAGYLWFLITLASSIVTIYVVTVLSRTSMVLVSLSVTVTSLIPYFISSTIAPLPIALLCAAAYCIGNRRWTAATVLLGLGCVEPHVAFPVLFGCLIIVPEMRVRIAIMLAALLLLTLTLTPISLNVEYLRKVLPAQAASELHFVWQYGLSSLFVQAGLSDRTALALGSIQYAIFAVLGIWIAARTKDVIPGAPVFVPMAAAVMGGTYVHLGQIAGVLPLAFILASRLRTVNSYLAATLLSLPSPIFFAAASPTTRTFRIVRWYELAEAGWSQIALAARPSLLSQTSVALAYIGMALVCFSLARFASRYANPARDA